MSTSHIVVGFAVLGVLATGCATGGTAAPTPTVTVTEMVTEPETSVAVSDEQPDPAQPSTGPWGDPLLIVDGRWLVGEDADIPPTGVVMTPDSVYDCLWRVTDAEGVVVEDVTVTNPGGTSVSLQDGDLFESVNCTVWRFVDLSEPRPISVPGESKLKDLGDPVPPGTYIVGKNIRAGTYSQRADGLSDKCAYSVKRDFGPRIMLVLSFETTNIGARSSTNEVVDLQNGDIFESTCGMWQRYEWRR